MAYIYPEAREAPCKAAIVPALNRRIDGAPAFAAWEEMLQSLDDKGSVTVDVFANGYDRDLAISKAECIR